MTRATLSAEAREVLAKARQLIERGWTKHAYARDRYGKGLGCYGVYDEGACEWCLMGAVRRALADGSTSRHQIGAYDATGLGFEVVSAVAAQVPPGLYEEDDHPHDRATNWNDREGRTQEEVLALLDATLVEEEATS